MSLEIQPPKCQPTPTERAFLKAQQFDIVMGYVMEKIGCEHLPRCPRELRIRYNLEAGAEAALIIAFIEQWSKVTVTVNGKDLNYSETTANAKPREHRTV